MSHDHSSLRFRWFGVEDERPGGGAVQRLELFPRRADGCLGLPGACSAAKIEFLAANYTYFSSAHPRPPCSADSRVYLCEDASTQHLPPRNLLLGSPVMPKSSWARRLRQQRTSRGIWLHRETQSIWTAPLNLMVRGYLKDAAICH
jgi:hypothetical protein